MQIKRFISSLLMCAGAVGVLYFVGENKPVGIALCLVVALAGGFTLRRKNDD